MSPFTEVLSVVKDVGAQRHPFYSELQFKTWYNLLAREVEDMGKE